MEHPGNLPMYRRFVTTHDAAGKAVFSKDVNETATVDRVLDNGGSALSLTYTTTGLPVDLGSDKDMKIYEQDRKELPGIYRSGGSILWTVDTAPGKTSIMHRTVSLDVGAVISGEVELILDSGESRIMKAGDVCVQRGTMHAWRNNSKTQWLRMLFFVQPIVPVTVDGKELAEDMTGAPGIPDTTK